MTTLRVLTFMTIDLEFFCLIVLVGILHYISNLIVSQIIVLTRIVKLVEYDNMTSSCAYFPRKLFPHWKHFEVLCFYGKKLFIQRHLFLGRGLVRFIFFFGEHNIRTNLSDWTRVDFIG